MTLISYAQNFEDVMLWRALKHVENGFYIDVGANDPQVDSVTKAFYDSGWRGVNVEPLSRHFLELTKARPRDVNLQCAVGAEEGELSIWECDVRGWATMSADVAAEHERHGHVGSWHRVSVVSLEDVFATHALAEVHFLKVDVEGFEEAVLRGNNWAKYRPWIVVVEATLPMSQCESYEGWEPILLEAKYQLAYVDGLNRFYLAQERSELLPAFKYPPNVFDGFKLIAQQDAEIRAVGAEARAAATEARAAAAEAHIGELINSASWRITAPLRSAMSVWRRIREKLS